MKIIIPLFLLLTTGCATTTLPSSGGALSLNNEFSSQAEIAIVNAQPSARPMRIGTNMSANLNAWTEVAVEVTARELAKRGMQAKSDSDRTLKIAVSDARTSKLPVSLNQARFGVNWVKSSTELDLTVSTGDGYSAAYTVANSATHAAGTPSRATNGAMMSAVAELLSDPEIVSYLTK